MFYGRRSPLRFLVCFVITTALGLSHVSAIAQEADKPAKKTAAAEKKKAKTDTESKASKPEKTSRKERNKSDKADKATRERLQAIEAKLDSLVEKLGNQAAGKAKQPAAETKAVKPADKSETKPAAKPPKAADPKSKEGAPEKKTSVDAAKKDEKDSKPSKEVAPKVADRGKLPKGLKLEDAWLKDMPWRSIGPANMSGRITDIAIHDQDPSLWWIATASGGLLKTTNSGVTIEHQFDKQNTVSIGAIAADPTNKDVLWVGTGESNPRNSVSYGDGVYKTVDGGKTFEHLGLKETYQIASICIDPKNTDTVYVGAAGRLYGPNRERGVFKTTDGGKTWEHSLYIDDSTGVIDMVMNPEDPNVIIAAMWNRMRDGFDSWPGSVKKPDGVDGYDPIRKYGAGGGLYKTTDGGKNWKKLTKGLPSSMTGRIGIDWQTQDKHAIYAIIDCEKIGQGPKPFDVYLGITGLDVKIPDSKNTQPVVTQLVPKCPAETAGVKVGDVLKKADGKELGKFDQLLDILREKKIGDKLSLVVQRDEKELSLETRLFPRPGSNQEMPSVWLGVTGEDKDGKLILKTIVAKGPAEKAGLKPNDIVLSINNKKAETYTKLIAAVQEKSKGETLKLKVQRADKQLELIVTLEDRPLQRPRTSNAIMGIQGRDAPEGTKGAVMLSVTKGGPSEKAGLKTGDIVQKVEQKEIKEYSELIAEIRSRQPEDKMKVEVLRGKEKVKLEITLGDRRGSSSSTRPYTYSYFGQRPNVQDMQGADGHEYGGVYKSTDAGDTWQRVNSLNTRPMYFSLIRVDPMDDQKVYILGVSQFQSQDGGQTFSADFGRGVHADGHDLWIDPSDGRHMVIAGDGGFYSTFDRGANWDHVNTAAIGQFYHVAISLKEPYWVVGGLQDNGSWAGPAISRNGGAINEDWISVSGGDGFVCRVDPNDPDLFYYESQNGSMGRRHLQTGERAGIRPARKQGVEYRFNWNTPFLLSSRNSKIFYSAGNYVFRSLDRGNNLQAISPEITLTKRGSATALSESPRDPDVLYVGTDDGALWVTKDGGDNWSNITDNLGIAQPRWVNTIEASRFANGRVYVVLDGHRSDDDNPYVFVSEDFGETFSPLHKGLPWGTTRCLREDIANQDLLYLGSEFGFWVSIDRGQNWAKFNQTLPTVAIHDLALHPTNGEIVLATHGRSLWACDVTALRNIKTSEISSKVAFYKPTDVTRWRSSPSRGRTNRRYVGQNPGRGARLWYSLPKKSEKVSLQVKNIEGKLISELPGSTDAGLHGVSWNLTQTAPTGSRSRGASTGFRGVRGGRPVPSGTYKVTLVVDEKEVQSHVVTIEQDPALVQGAVSDEEYETMLLEEEQRRQQKWDAKTEGRDVYKDD